MIQNLDLRADTADGGRIQPAATCVFFHFSCNERTSAMKRVHVKSRSSCAVVLFLLIGGATAGEHPPSAKVAQEAQELLAETTTADGPGAAILVARGDEIIFRGARGMAQLELGVPMRASNIFRIGSNTKQFAAASILKLVEQGRLSLTDPLAKYLPDYPNGNHITVHELLNHTSGIKDYTEIEGYFRSAIREDLDTSKLIDVFKNLPVDFAPGTNWKYSSSGYILIGAVLEKVTGKPWNEAIRELVLAPLALTHTNYVADQTILAGRAAGYSVDAAGHEANAPYFSMTQAGAAGGLVSNVDDLFHWMRALHSGKILNAESYRRLVTPVPTPSGSPRDYGYGIEIHQLRGMRTLEHGGRDPGFMSYTVFIPDAAISVVALTNTDSPHFDLSVLTHKLAASALGTPYPKRHPVELTADQMRDLAGVYKRGDGRRIIAVRDGKLYTKRDGGGAHLLRASSNNELYFDEVLDYFTIVRNRSGGVVALDEFPDGEAPAQREPKLDESAPSINPEN